MYKYHIYGGYGKVLRYSNTYFYNTQFNSFTWILKYGIPKTVNSNIINNWPYLGRPYGIIHHQYIGKVIRMISISRVNLPWCFAKVFIQYNSGGKIYTSIV